MTLPDYARANFETLARAFASGHAALVDCTDRRTGEQVPTVCAVAFDGEQYVITPFARLFTMDPYDDLLPPGAEEAAP